MLLGVLVTISSFAITQINDSLAQPIDEVKEEISKIREDMGEVKYRIGVLEDNLSTETKQNTGDKEILEETPENSKDIENNEITTKSFLITPVFAQNMDNTSQNIENSENWVQKYYMSIIAGIIAIISGVMWQVKKKEENKKSKKGFSPCPGIEFVKPQIKDLSETLGLDEFLRQSEKAFSQGKPEGFRYGVKWEPKQKEKWLPESEIEISELFQKKLN